MAIINYFGTIPSLSDLKTSAPKGLSLLGTPIFDDITFPSGIYVNENGDEIEYPELSIQSVQVTISRKKNIIETPVSGKKGSFKQYISSADYMISVRGKLTEMLNLFPADYLDAYVEIQEITQAIEVQSKLLNDFFNINQVIITSFDVSTIQGVLNEVDISIELMSDFEVDLNNFLLNPNE